MKCILCGNKMIKRHGKHGDFYGCKSYPKCKFTVDNEDMYNYIVSNIKLNTDSANPLYEDFADLLYNKGENAYAIINGDLEHYINHADDESGFRFD